MSEQEKKIEVYVSTTDHYWGKAGTLAEALKNANVDWMKPTLKIAIAAGEDIRPDCISGGCSGVGVYNLGVIQIGELFDDLTVLHRAYDIIQTFVDIEIKRNSPIEQAIERLENEETD